MSVEDGKKANRRGAGVLTALGYLKVSRMEGFVDRVVAGEIIGWALDAGRPERRVHVVARVNTRIVAETLADLPRRDLMALGRGDGRHGFRLRIPGDLPTADRSSIIVEAVAKPRNVALKRGRVSVPATDVAVPPPSIMAMAVSVPDAPRPASRPGILERFANGEIVGWAANPEDDGGPAQVDLFEDERFLGVAICDRERSDLAGGRAPEAAKGFVFKLAAGQRVENPKRLRARIAGSRLELDRSKTFSIGEPTLDPSAPKTGANTPKDSATRRTPELRPPLARAASAPVRGVTFLICGPGSADDVKVTRRSCLTQQAGDVDVRILSDNEALNIAELKDRRAVVWLTPGQEVDSNLARLLELDPDPQDAWTWNPPSDSASHDYPRVRALAGDLDGAIALSGATMATIETSILEALKAGAVDEAAARVADQTLRWKSFPSRLSARTGPERPLETRPRAAAPKRVSIAVWSQEPGSVAEFEAPDLGASADIELLLIDEALSPETIERFQQAPSVTSVRLVDPPTAPGLGHVWRALSEAATGQVVVLHHSDVRISDPTDLLVMGAWVLSEGVGAASGAIRPDGGAATAGLRLHKGEALMIVVGVEPKNSPRLVDAAPAEFAIISRAALARVGGIDAERLPNRLADVDLCARLASDGYATLAFGGVNVASSQTPVALGEVNASEKVRLALAPSSFG